MVMIQREEKTTLPDHMSFTKSGELSAKQEPCPRSTAFWKKLPASLTAGIHPRLGDLEGSGTGKQCRNNTRLLRLLNILQMAGRGPRPIVRVGALQAEQVNAFYVSVPQTRRIGRKVVS
mmetsp:Transcript_15206/g.25779  ORF Transcript_15206/g.25779 Transcript_15206/m.25779 type:complete len:119 (+) Transcript_15206:839-1195(+)